MARQARIDYPGAFHHIMSRGFKREILFDDLEDYQYYINCLDEFMYLKYKILEYCLMPNHIHLLLQTGNVPLQKILKSINTRFALYKSRKRQLPGPIFQGRPKSILIVSKTDLKIVGRYILRNPVKANLVNKPNDYKWSSYRNLNRSNNPDWYDNTIILRSINKNKITALLEYKKFISQPLKSDEKEYPLERFSGIAVGTKVLYEKVLKMVSREKRSSGQSYTRKINWNRRIKNILKKHDICIEDLCISNSKSSISIKRKIAYIMKILNHENSKKIMNYLQISQPTLSRYVSKIKKDVKSGKIKIGDI